MNKQNNQGIPPAPKATLMTTSFGGTSKDQIIIELGSGEIFFQSYDKTIAACVNGQLYIDGEGDYIRATEHPPTTSKFLYRFLESYFTGRRINKNEVKKMVKYGELLLANLNK